MTRWIRPSTRAFFTEASRDADDSLSSRLHGYIYGRWPYFYISLATGRHPLSGPAGKVLRSVRVLLRANDSRARARARIKFAHGYHGKVLPVQEAKRLVQINKSVDLGNLEQVIPYDRARRIVLKNPGHIVALKCPCRASSPHPCEPLQVCLIIGEPFAGFILEHHPGKARSITSDEACRILEQEHARGHVQHAFFKDAMLGRFYAICNCCSCCCGAMQAHRNGVPMLASSGYAADADQELCIKCGECAQACPFQAIAMSREGPVVSQDLCMGCGVCVSRCPVQGLKLKRQKDKSPPLEVNSLLHGRP
ncbi:4Fe-4S binding protein [Desulfonatronospira sp. MSAO_Bac3]|uniref:4Fe-4S binding protein n=1 Tax=Desulfonatronospira sp. MSAO_Bac3 TaxID=2293857 RepID=UPI000FF20A5A|nr:4Fe-4S binding protein [Desulfonatronospira sp. MSAO_Bac3]RQD78055.1 MAG: 4Fe-4S dicluster domain-containing protein [Desulfonatronospira sp. MSAO_Bac3]